MANLDTLMGIAGGTPGSGGPFLTLFADNADLTVPDGSRLVYVMARSNTSILTVTFPLIQGSMACALIIVAPDGAANTVTMAAAAGNTLLTVASGGLTGDNIAFFMGLPGSTDWEGHIGA